MKFVSIAAGPQLLKTHAGPVYSLWALDDQGALWMGHLRPGPGRTGKDGMSTQPKTALEHVQRAQSILEYEPREGDLANNAWRFDAHLRVAQMLLDIEQAEADAERTE